MTRLGIQPLKVCLVHLPTPKRLSPIPKLFLRSPTGSFSTNNSLPPPAPVPALIQLYKVLLVSDLHFPLRLILASGDAEDSFASSVLNILAWLMP